ncbi:hypothetical protein MSP7336_01480 [Mycobacterium shimoidei]|uniref:Uncharacterized protein n=1 Tax=Mycobacterium shimoidei TaxID=29313 RepID=A0A375YWG6_MYCSH|nr:hypothetical protein [Mycobacterium shimoidei]SRX93244.1 hypothetical protein MSP7336_01480 [Mycobacterium shimoidei]
MASEVWAAVIGGVAGLATGALGSVIAPWVNWGIEKRRSDRQHRRDLVKAWREGVTYEGHDFVLALNSNWYETLRPNMKPETVERLERQRTSIVPPDNHRHFKDVFTGEIDRIEREWKL